MRLPLTAQNSAIKRCPQCRRPCIIWQHVTFCSRYTFLMVSNPDRIAPGRRLPESTQSILHHYFIRSHAGTNTYLLIIDKFLLIRYQATVKQSTLFLLMVLDLHAGKRLSSFSTILSVLFRVKSITSNKASLTLCFIIRNTLLAQNIIYTCRNTCRKFSLLILCNVKKIDRIMVTINTVSRMLPFVLH